MRRSGARVYFYLFLLFNDPSQRINIVAIGVKQSNCCLGMNKFRSELNRDEKLIITNVNVEWKLFGIELLYEKMRKIEKIEKKD